MLREACCAVEEFMTEDKEEEQETGGEEQELVHFGIIVSNKGRASSREAE